MAKVNTVLEDNIFIRYSVILLGMLVLSLGVNGFLRPAQLLSGGVSGISVAINYVTDMNIGILTLLINVPVFILGFIYLEKEFCISSLINVVIYSIILGVTENIGMYIHINDILLQTVCGGVLCGVGTGLVFKTKSSLGGTDIIGAILKFKKNIEIKDGLIAMNGIIVVAGGILFGVEKALYTMIGMYLNTQVMSTVKDAMNNQKSVMIISKYSEIIAEDIMRELVRGVTFIEAEGAYTKEKKKIIFCIVASKEIPKLKEISLKHDKRVFVSVNDVTEVKGRGFKEKYL